jgi:hypothetical protein
MLVKKRTQSEVYQEFAFRILRTVPVPESFLFFTDVGQYTGEMASSLESFLEKLKNISIKAIEFHFSREDFVKWIKGTLGDTHLADRICKIDKSTHGEELRKTLQAIIERRVNQLKQLQQKLQ